MQSICFMRLDRAMSVRLTGRFWEEQIAVTTRFVKRHYSLFRLQLDANSPHTLRRIRKSH